MNPKTKLIVIAAIALIVGTAYGKKIPGVSHVADMLPGRSS